MHNDSKSKGQNSMDNWLNVGTRTSCCTNNPKKLLKKDP